MKREVLELKELRDIETGEGFETEFINVKRYPVYLTNASMKYGRDLGLIETSLMGEMARLQGLGNLQALDVTSENADIGKIAEIDDLPMITIIYLAFIGANRSITMDFDEFISLYHLDFSETITLYSKLIASSFTGQNNFAAGLKKATATSKKK